MAVLPVLYMVGACCWIKCVVIFDKLTDNTIVCYN